MPKQFGSILDRNTLPAQICAESVAISVNVLFFNTNTLVTVLCIVILSVSCVALAGCGSGKAPAADSQYVGTWKATSAEFKGEAQDINEVLGGHEFVIVLNEDGTAGYTYDTETNCTWTETDKGFKVKGDDINMKFEGDGSKVTCSVLGVTLIFEKQ